MYPRLVHALALPTLQRITLHCDLVPRNKDRASPVLEGRFEQLHSISIYGFTMERSAIDAVILP